MIESLNVNFWKVLSSAVTASTTCLQLKYVKIVKDVAQCANSYKEVCTRVTDVINKCEWKSENRNFTMSDEINDMQLTSSSQGSCLQYDENHSIVLTGIPPKSASSNMISVPSDFILGANSQIFRGEYIEWKFRKF